MPIDAWQLAQKELDQLIILLSTENLYVVQEYIPEEYDELEERSPSNQANNIVLIRGSIISFVDRLDDEFTKSLQNIDPHGTEYIERLRDEKVLYQSISLAQGHFERSGQTESVARVIARRLEHIYSKASLSDSKARGEGNLILLLSIPPICSPMRLWKLSSKSTPHINSFNRHIHSPSQRPQKPWSTQSA